MYKLSLSFGGETTNVIHSAQIPVGDAMESKCCRREIYEAFQSSDAANADMGRARERESCLSVCVCDGDD